MNALSTETNPHQQHREMPQSPRAAAAAGPAGSASYGADPDDPDEEVTCTADFTVRTLRLPSAPVHGTLFVPGAAEPSAAVLLIGGSGSSEPSYVGQARHVSRKRSGHADRDPLTRPCPRCGGDRSRER